MLATAMDVLVEVARPTNVSSSPTRVARYASSYDQERDRLLALPAALDSYNRLRPHRALGGQTPLQRVNNLSGTYI